MQAMSFTGIAAEQLEHRFLHASGVRTTCREFATVASVPSSRKASR